MDHLEPAPTLNDLLLAIYQLAAEECFPGVVFREHSGQLRIKSLIDLPVGGDFPQFVHSLPFQVPENSLHDLNPGDHVTFSCDIPVPPHRNKRDMPFAEDLIKADKSTIKKIKDDINLRLKDHLRNERLAERQRQLESQAEERERRLDDRERELDQQRITLKSQAEERERHLDDRKRELEQQTATLRSQEESVLQRERDVQQKESRYEVLLQDEEGDNATLGTLPAADFHTLDLAWPKLLQSVGHIVSNDGTAERGLLLALLSASITGELVILDGPVGVGKTSVASRAAKILAGTPDALDLIPVRPGWIDSTDLLGFYDPNQREYHPSPLLTALDRAKKRATRLCLICLDELNLARIENYGADLLSCMENRRDRKLPLYSPDVARSLRAELGLLQLDNGCLTRDDSLRRERIALTLNMFPARFVIPDNVVFIGTLNSDETTYDISPKVIDRAFVIRLPTAVLGTSLTEAEDNGQQTCVIDLCDFKQEAIAAKATNTDFPWLLDQVAPLQASLRVLGIPLGYRTRRDLEDFAAAARVVGLETREVVLEHFILSKILPRIRCQRNDQTEKAWEAFQRRITPFLSNHSTSIIQDLKQQWADPLCYSIRYFSINR